MENMVVLNDSAALDLLLEKVYQHAGYDFREYKRGTVTRRLYRRLCATGSKTYSEYMQFLDTNPEEYQNLANYLNIGVSGFFRRPDAFQQVACLVLPELVSDKRRRGERSLKFWSTACARGEEPYSIAILLSQFLGSELHDFDITIYATDINRQSLKEAQAGIYTPRDVGGLTSTILETYFTHHDGGYVVKVDIRQMIRLSHFDLATATISPFVNLDCIFCCNALIYLQTRLQERVIGMLYDSLNVPGYLVLGEAETLPGSLGEKLECLDTKAKIYRKNRRGAHD